MLRKPPLLVESAGAHGGSVAEAVLMSGDFDLIGFLDDRAFASGGDVGGLKVLGPANAFADCLLCTQWSLLATMPCD